MSELSICIPTYNRPDLLERALTSVLTNPPKAATNVEIVVADNSADDRSGRVVSRLTADWPGPVRYHKNEHNLGMVGNFNRCLELASGRWVLLLHDDDYLLPSGLERLLAGLEGALPEDRALLYGVRVVDGSGRLLRAQTSRRDRRLTRREAVRRLLTNSSFVRFPGIAVRADVYREAGPFDPTLGGAADLEMWMRIFGMCGVRLMPCASVAYVVHPGAATEGVFNEGALKTISRIFDDAVRQRVLPEKRIRRCQAHFVHQFVLAGTFRRLRARDLAGAKRVLGLLAQPDVSRLGPSPRWMPVRAAFTVLTAGVKE